MVSCVTGRRWWLRRERARVREGTNSFRSSKLLCIVDPSRRDGRTAGRQNGLSRERTQWCVVGEQRWFVLVGRYFVSTNLLAQHSGKFLAVE